MPGRSEPRRHDPGLYDGAGRLHRSHVLVLATGTGLAVANNYYVQPLLPAISVSLHLSTTVSGLIVTIAQAGYAVGLAFLLPLGDLLERRRLVAFFSLATAVGLVWMGASPGAGSLLAAAFAVGVVTVVAQMFVPFGASLAGEQERGRVVGSVMSGLLLGILLARTAAGLLAEAWNWRLVYFVAAGAMVVEAAILYLRLPTWKGDVSVSYPALLKSVGRLMVDEPVLRLRSAFGFLDFAAFSALWTSLAFLLSRHYHYSTGVIGLFGLAGAGGAASASVFGRLSDRRRPTSITGVTAALLLIGWVALYLGGRSIALLVVGIVVLDVGIQGMHLTNQGEIFRLHPAARSRLTAAYMVVYFFGGAAGSALSAAIYAGAGWNGVSVLGGAIGLAAVVLWLATIRRSLAQAGEPAPEPGPGATATAVAADHPDRL